MKKKFFAVLLTLSMVIASFSGCSSTKGTPDTTDTETSVTTSDNSESSEVTTTPAEEDVTLTFTYKQSASNDPLEKWLADKDVIGRFEAENPGVKIELVPISSSEGDYATLLALQLSSDRTAPNIFMEDTYMTATDAATGYLACLDDYLADWDDYDNYMDGTKEAVKGTDGKSYGIPISTDSRGIFYNMEVLNKAGVETPWQPKTWDDVLDTARKIKESGQDAAPLYLIVGSSNGEGVSMQTFEMLLYGTGDQMYENNKWLVGSQSLTDTFKFIDTVYVEEDLGVDLDVALATDALSQVQQGMANGTVGMMLTVCTSAGAWASTGTYPVDDVESKIGFAAMPTQNGGDPATVTMSGGWSWAISEYCENKDLAFKFLAFCGNQENATYRSLYDGRMSPRLDSTDIEEYAGRAYIDETTAYMENAYVRPKSESYAMVSTQIQTIVEELASGSLTPEQAAEEYKSRVVNIVGEENTFTK